MPKDEGGSWGADGELTLRLSQPRLAEGARCGDDVHGEDGVGIGGGDVLSGFIVAYWFRVIINCCCCWRRISCAIEDDIEDD